MCGPGDPSCLSPPLCSGRCAALHARALHAARCRSDDREHGPGRHLPRHRHHPGGERGGGGGTFLGIVRVMEGREGSLLLSPRPRPYVRHAPSPPEHSSSLPFSPPPSSLPPGSLQLIYPPFSPPFRASRSTSPSASSGPVLPASNPTWIPPAWSTALPWRRPSARPSRLASRSGTSGRQSRRRRRAGAARREGRLGSWGQQQRALLRS